MADIHPLNIIIPTPICCGEHTIPYDGEINFFEDVDKNEFIKIDGVRLFKCLKCSKSLIMTSAEKWQIGEIKRLITKKNMTEEEAKKRVYYEWWSCNAHIKTIAYFRGAYAFLSNFWIVRVTYKGLTFRSVEAAFQAAKSEDIETVKQFTLLDAFDAKKKGKEIKLRPDWEDVKIDIMTDLIRQKFCHAELRKNLRDTYPRPIVEGNYWKDTFWGVDLNTGIGENHLGIILMKIRDEIMEEVENKK